MKDQEIIKESDEIKMKRFRQAVTGNKLMTELQIRKMERNALIQQSEQFTFEGLDKMTEKSVYRYVHYVFPSSPEVSSERRMWNFLMTRGHKLRKQYTLVKHCFH